MRAFELFAGTPVAIPEQDFEVLGITHDSRQVQAGDLFVALEGELFDGRKFAVRAQERGAAGVVGRGMRPEGLEGPWLSVDDPRWWFGPLAARVYGHPDRQLTMVGVTGTNGKTTIVNVLRSVLEAANRPCASLGTLGYRFGAEEIAGSRTTPEAGDLFSILRRSADNGAEAVVMEVSSHALELHRVNGLEFDVALFTNLTRDHLDFHGDLETYFSAKQKLFSRLKSGGRSVVNVDDEYGRRLAAGLDTPLTYGDSGDVRVVHAELTENGIAAEVETPRGTIEMRSMLLGRYNLENLLAVVAVAEALELSQQDVLAGIAACPTITGRMELIDAGQPFPVFIDYAHTHRALAAALTSLAEFSSRRIVLVFGCGGDRDRGKRKLMGRIAGEGADLAILTNDNPRTEDPAAIIAEVESGLRQSGSESFVVVPDRREAIRQAMERADSGWAVLVAGKGHEEEQIIGERILPFSDRREIVMALEEKFGQGNAD